MDIRPERPEDFDAIDEIVRGAFGSEGEVTLVHRIRESASYLPELSFVATQDDKIFGHIMLSYVFLGPRQVLQLSPLAVDPKHQRAGIGIALTEHALAKADERGEPLVLVLGHPEYYPRFGFESARGLGLDPPSDEITDDPWMAKKLGAYDPALRGHVTFDSTAFEGT